MMKDVVMVGGYQEVEVALSRIIPASRFSIAINNCTWILDL